MKTLVCGIVAYILLKIVKKKIMDVKLAVNFPVKVLYTSNSWLFFRADDHHPDSFCLPACFVVLSSHVFNTNLSCLLFVFPLEHQQKRRGHVP